METSGIADRIALLAHDHLVDMYEGMGFEGAGKSNVRFAGGGWNDLVSEIPSLSDSSGNLTWARYMTSQNIVRDLDGPMQ